MTTPYVDPQSVHNPTAGAAIPATWGDTVRNDLEFLIAPPGCFVYRTASMTGTANNAWTAVTFPTGSATESWDTDSFHSLSTNSSRMTVPTGLGGVYALYGGVGWAANGTGIRAVVFFKNGAQSGPEATADGNGTSGNALAVYTEMSLAAGDYVELSAFQNSGGTLDVGASAASTSFGIRWVSR